MLNCFVPGSQGLDRLDPPPADIPEKCVWVDLLEPTLAEERAVERLLAIDVPSREEMREIETSSRLYEENGTLYMTATVVTKIDTDRPESATPGARRLIAEIQQLKLAVLVRRQRIAELLSEHTLLDQ